MWHGSSRFTHRQSPASAKREEGKAKVSRSLEADSATADPSARLRRAWSQNSHTAVGGMPSTAGGASVDVRTHAAKHRSTRGGLSCTCWPRPSPCSSHHHLRRSHTARGSPSGWVAGEGEERRMSKFALTCELRGLQRALRNRGEKVFCRRCTRQGPSRATLPHCTAHTAPRVPLRASLCPPCSMVAAARRRPGAPPSRTPTHRGDTGRSPTTAAPPPRPMSDRRATPGNENLYVGACGLGQSQSQSGGSQVASRWEARRGGRRGRGVGAGVGETSARGQ